MNDEKDTPDPHEPFDPFEFDPDDASAPGEADAFEEPLMEPGPAPVSMGSLHNATSMDDFEQPPAPPPKKFCSTCGSAWQLAWEYCEVCIEKQSTPARTSSRNEDSSIGSVLALYFVLLGSFIVLIFADGNNSAQIMLAVTIIDSVIVLLWLVATGFARSFGERVLTAVHWYPMMALAGVGTFLIAALSIGWLVNAFDIPAQSMSDEFLSQGYGWITVILAVCVQPAIIEEIAFRGIILDGLRKNMSDREAIIVSALLFAILHVHILGIPYLFAMGAGAAYARIRSGSLLPCMVMHFVHNSLVVMQEAKWIPG